MKKFPEWVPEEVVEFYRRELNPKEYTDENTQLGIEALCRVMESVGMRKGWEAIAKRGDEIRPWFYAQIVIDAARSAERMDRLPPREQIETFRELTSKVQALSQEFDESLGCWADEVMLHYFGARPDKVILDLADNMETFTQMVEENRKFLTDRTGKPGSKNAKRTFIIRSMSESVTELWGTPLHETVAATVSAIYCEDEVVDPETVRKIVAYSMKK